MFVCFCAVIWVLFSFFSILMYYFILMIAPVRSTKKLLSKAGCPGFHWLRTMTFLLQHSLGIATFHTTKGHGHLPIYGVIAKPRRIHCLDINLSKALFSHIITLLLHSDKKCMKCLPNGPFMIECYLCLLHTPCILKVLGLNSVINALLVTYWFLEFNQTLNNVYGDSEHIIHLD